MSLRTKIVASAALAAGTDVFTIVDLSGTNDPVSAGLMLTFINRVAKLR